MNSSVTPKASSVQWRLLNPNRPSGMPPPVPIVSFDYDKKPIETEKPKDGAYYYNDRNSSKKSNFPQTKISVQDRLKVGKKINADQFH